MEQKARRGISLNAVILLALEQAMAAQHQDGGHDDA